MRVEKENFHRSHLNPNKTPNQLFQVRPLVPAPARHLAQDGPPPRQLPPPVERAVGPRRPRLPAARRGALPRRRARARGGARSRPRRGPARGGAGRRRGVPRVRGRRGRGRVVAGQRGDGFFGGIGARRRRREPCFLCRTRLLFLFLRGGGRLGAGRARLLLRRPRQRLLGRRPRALLRAGAAPPAAAPARRRRRSSLRLGLGLSLFVLSFSLRGQPAQQRAVRGLGCGLLVPLLPRVRSTAFRGPSEGAGGAVARDRCGGAQPRACAGEGQPVEARARGALWEVKRRELFLSFPFSFPSTPPLPLLHAS